MNDKAAAVGFLAVVIACVGAPQIFIPLFAGVALVYLGLWQLGGYGVRCEAARMERIEIGDRADAQQEAYMRGEPYGLYGDFMPARDEPVDDGD